MKGEVNETQKTNSDKAMCPKCCFLNQRYLLLSFLNNLSPSKFGYMQHLNFVTATAQGLLQGALGCPDMYQ